MTPREKVDAALEKCEQACPCVLNDDPDNGGCRPHEGLLCVCFDADYESPCLWSGHAAITNYGKVCYEAAKEELQVGEPGKEQAINIAILAARLGQMQAVADHFSSQPCPEWTGKTSLDWIDSEIHSLRNEIKKAGDSR